MRLKDRKANFSSTAPPARVARVSWPRARRRRRGCKDRRGRLHLRLQRGRLLLRRELECRAGLVVWLRQAGLLVVLRLLLGWCVRVKGLLG
jgi:hypothetical protein